MSNGLATGNTPLKAKIQALQKLGYKIEVLNASLGGEFPVTAISLINPKNATLFVSFGAHPVLEISLEPTMTELMKGRSLENLDSFEVPTFDMDLIAESFNLESHFVDSNSKLIRDMVLNFTQYDPQEIISSIESLEASLNIEKYIGVIFE